MGSVKKITGKILKDEINRDWVKTLRPSGLLIKLKGCRSKALFKNKQRNDLGNWEKVLPSLNQM